MKENGKNGLLSGVLFCRQRCTVKRNDCGSTSHSFKVIFYRTDEKVVKVEELSDLLKPEAIEQFSSFVMTRSCI